MTTPERAARLAAGADARTRLPLEALAEVGQRADRDPVRLVLRQEDDRIADLLPLRHERMAASSFAFYRGTALVMADDLGASEHSGLSVQLCGDAHAANFGLFGSPERRLLFDLNDFDETHPGPFEWDVKRLVASIELAGRAIDLPTKARRRVVRRAAREYRRAMLRFSTMSELEVWYSHADVDEAIRIARSDRSTAQGVATTTIKQARRRSQLRSLQKLTTVVDGERRFLPDLPLVQPLSGFPGAEQITAVLTTLLDDYRATLLPDRRTLLAHYRLVDIALKVVGVGSVGTRCWILLMQGVDADDAIILQAKEATSSVLEAYLEPCTFEQHGERVVLGQRLMQAASDLMLGWQRARGIDGVERDYYLRQLHDWKGGVTLETLQPDALDGYGQLCAWVLARAHARSGDRFALAGYLGEERTADEAFADFASSYADLAERDHAAFVASLAPGAS
ncbi:DUF2252 domain-containing protein [Cellulomonas sp. HZM]|uniref:DUF2252 domain-containing protein n=1 Tax=Cellulomonas sp. HZM TaxID=1454010 RepID=UPI0004939ACC|nr:DUF2252 domain-containing protein [Cellulomonas sp. HZM]